MMGSDCLLESPQKVEFVEYDPELWQLTRLPPGSPLLIDPGFDLSSNAHYIHPYYSYNDKLVVIISLLFVYSIACSLLPATPLLGILPSAVSTRFRDAIWRTASLHDRTLRQLYFNPTLFPAIIIALPARLLRYFTLTLVTSPTSTSAPTQSDDITVD
jgi:hypothetical protein